MQTLLTTIFATWDHDGPGWWIVFVPLFWIAVVVGVIVLFRSRGPWGPWPSAQPRETALEVLERRYAEGAVDEDEYRRRRSVLTGQGARPQE
jgi:putative membrane protein